MKKMELRALIVLMALLVVPVLAEAQTVQYIGATCTFSWNPNTEPDLAGYRAWVSEGGGPGSTPVDKPAVILNKTATSHLTSTTCAALGVTTDGLKRFNVQAFDTAGNMSPTAFVDAVRDSGAPAMPGGLNLSSPQPVAMSITPNPAAQQATVAWVPGTCQKEFIVSRLVSGQWREIGRTQETWYKVPLVNQVSQPYGVSAVCG